MMAKNVDNSHIIERRLRPIYDCLDNGNNKKALQEADKVLKKQKDLLCAKTDKAVAEAVTQLKTLMDTEDENKQQLSYDSLTEIHKCLQRIDTNYELYFYQLLDECRVVLPQSRKNKELEDRLAELNCKQSNREYNSMTSSVSVGSNPAKQSAESVSFGAEFRQMRPTLIATANAFLTIGGTFFFCYKAVEYSLPEPNISSQILSGLFGALVVAMAEIYFLVRII
ncbi:unnamed protein product [Medioppia subpectinata]|uniref:Uncharacterized protein n=1 Tax=Medioppia subpectinata TaxID=1979941 RepID=A0A7R9KLQ5_9ACAR|nr:unnamed protein product [Medioppia subpectinata]CAG2104690.1 unnamed protein product [Medioppia subpectinata]